MITVEMVEVLNSLPWPGAFALASILAYVAFMFWLFFKD